MRLINVSSLLVEEFIGRDFPPYGILSHTWEGGEVSYQDMRDGTAREKYGYRKIEMTCKLGAADGLQYVWVDTCCIDKSSSAELTEAVNSMFKWYQRAANCYVFLSDLIVEADVSKALRTCRWFTRGWTLQELIAPPQVSFFDQRWNLIGSKTSLLETLSSITGVDSNVLSRTSLLSSVAVARKMSWAAHRETTREEDAAYSLLGIFGVNMPLLYGEGPKAFLRLQEEIIKETCDLSIFAWTAELEWNNQDIPRYSGVLASSSKEFSSCRRIKKTADSTFHTDFSITNRGVRLHTSLMARPMKESQGWIYAQDLDCSSEDDEASRIAILLRKCGPDLYIREDPSSLAFSTNEFDYAHCSYRTSYFLSKLSETQVAQQNNSLIIGCRSSALQILVPPSFRLYDAKPTSHWDGQDSVFFSTNASDSWCSVQFDGEIVFGGKKVEVSCFFICLHWNMRHRGKPFLSTIVRTSDCSEALKSQLLSGVGQEEYDVVPWAMRYFFGLVPQNAVALTEVSPTARMSYRIGKRFLTSICNNEMYQVEIKLEL